MRLPPHYGRIKVSRSRHLPGAVGLSNMLDKPTGGRLDAAKLVGMNASSTEEGAERKCGKDSLMPDRAII